MDLKSDRPQQIPTKSSRVGVKFQPNVQQTRVRNSGKIRLDEEDSTFCQKNADFYFAPSDSMDIDSYIDQAHSIASSRGGECLSAACEDPWHPLIFKCALSHIWETNEVLLSGSWCSQCDSMLSRAKLFASERRGQCISKYCGSTLTFKCEFGHVWDINALRYSKRWCLDCKNLEKKRKKEELQDRRRRACEEEALLQEEMLKQAKKQMNKVVDNESEIDSKATELAHLNLCGCPFEEVFLAYKILSSSDEFIIHKFSERSLYRYVARMVHPDKNKHPVAAEAFSKLSRLISVYK